MVTVKPKDTCWYRRAKEAKRAKEIRQIEREICELLARAERLRITADEMRGMSGRVKLPLPAVCFSRR